MKLGDVGERTLDRRQEEEIGKVLTRRSQILLVSAQHFGSSGDGNSHHFVLFSHPPDPGAYCILGSDKSEMLSDRFERCC